MTKILKALVVVCAIAAVYTPTAVAQHTEAHQKFDSTNATVTWRAVPVPSTSFAWLQVINWSTTTDVFVALGSDTSASKIVRIYAGYTKRWPAPLNGVSQILVKSASGSVRTHILFDY